MKANEQSRFDDLYKRHLRVLKLQGMSEKTIDAYARALRRVSPRRLLRAGRACRPRQRPSPSRGETVVSCARSWRRAR